MMGAAVGAHVSLKDISNLVGQMGNVFAKFAGNKRVFIYLYCQNIIK